MNSNNELAAPSTAQSLQDIVETNYSFYFLNLVQPKPSISLKPETLGRALVHGIVWPYGS